MKGADITSKRLPGFMPVMNSYAESFVKSIKTECLNKLIFTSEEQLRYAIKCYLFYYHHFFRPRKGLGWRMIAPLPQDEDGEIVE